MSDTTTQTTEVRDLVVTRQFDAPVEDVWHAWSDPDHVMRWWGPTGFTSPSCRMDFREGGTTIVHMQSPEYGEFFNTWSYRHIVPMQRIEFIQNFADREGSRLTPVEAGLPPDVPADVRNVVTFRPLGDGTEMTVTEYGYTSDAALELSKAGLEECLDKMAASFETP